MVAHGSSMLVQVEQAYLPGTKSSKLNGPLYTVLKQLKQLHLHPAKPSCLQDPTHFVTAHQPCLRIPHSSLAFPITSTPATSPLSTTPGLHSSGNNSMLSSPPTPSFP